VTVVEHAFIHVDPERVPDFVAMFPEARAVLASSPGFQWAELHHGLERPGVLLLLVGWESLDAHLVGFRQSERFPRWRALIGPYFTADPEVEHYEPAVARTP
jgi:heme-degrading monooxygenase HmoA